MASAFLTRVVDRETVPDFATAQERIRHTLETNERDLDGYFAIVLVCMYTNRPWESGFTG